MSSDGEALLACRNLKTYFPTNQGLIERVLGRERRYVRAVDGVDLRIGRGEIVGVAGESGCGKTTLGRTLVRLQDPTDGTIHFRGSDVTAITGGELKAFRREAQISFQDPFESLNPRRTVFATVREPLAIHGIGDAGERYERVVTALERAELQPAEEYLDRFPHQLSGGQRQRVAIARALVLEPAFLVADEPVSMLDVSVRAGVLDLLQRLNRELGIAVLMISHDLALLRHVCDRIGIMYLGRIVELGDTESVVREPTHPYAKALLSAAPEPNPFVERTRPDIGGSVPDPIDVPAGCRFADRCPEREPACERIDPPLLETGVRSDARRVACLRYYDPPDRERLGADIDSERSSDPDRN